MKSIFINTLKFLFFTAIGVGILYLVYQSQNTAFQAQCAKDGVAAADCSLLRKMIADFRSVHYFWIGMTLGAFTISNLARAYRWEMLLQPMGYTPRTRNTYLAIMFAYLANLAVSRIGEVVRCTLLARYEKIPVNRLLGTVVIDRLLDVICLALCIGLTFLVQFSTILNFLKTNADISDKLALLNNPLVWALVCLSMVAVVVAYWQRHRFRHFNLYEKGRTLLLGFADGLKSIGQLERRWLFLLYTVVIWSAYYFMTYFCFKAFDATANLGASAALTVFVFGSLGIVIPSPGGMGSFHFLVTAALLIYGINGGDAFSFANIQFIAVNSCIIFFGLMALIGMPLLNKKPLVA